MARININKIRVVAPTVIGDLYGGPVVNTEELITIRATNTTSSEILYRLYDTITADTTQASGVYSASDYKIAAGASIDVERNLEMSYGDKLQHRASATGLHIRVTGRKRSTL